MEFIRRFAGTQLTADAVIPSRRSRSRSTVTRPLGIGFSSNHHLIGGRRGFWEAYAPCD